MAEEKDYSLVRYIHKRIKNNKNFLCTITGPTGSGKSWTALSIAELLDPDFNVDRVIFKGKDLMKLINDGNLKPGSVIIWDEAGIDLSNRNWQSLTNKMLNALLQTFRHKNFILFFTVPYHDFIDASSKKLFHADFETQRINKGKEEVVLKPKLLQYNSNLRKWYRKYLKINQKGSIVKIRRWKVPKPSDELIKAYEVRKNAFTIGLNKDIGKQLEKMDPDEEDILVSTVDMHCPNCNNKWGYKGSAMWVRCTRCHKQLKNPKFSISIVVDDGVKPTPQLNLSIVQSSEQSNKGLPLL